MKLASLPLAALLTAAAGTLLAAETEPPVAIGSRRELFVDEALIGSLTNARPQLHDPVPREIAITLDAPWEGTGSGYHADTRDLRRTLGWSIGAWSSRSHGP